EPLLNVSKVALQRTLWQLLASHNDLGTIRIEHPIVRCVVRDGGTNVEDFLQGLSPAAGESRGGAGPVLQLTIVDGRVEFFSDRASQLGSIEQLQGEISLGGGRDPIRGSLELGQVSLPGQTKNAGKMVVSFDYQPAIAANSTAARVHSRIECTELPADILQIAAQRIGNDAQIIGLINGHVEVALLPESVELLERLQSSLQITDCRVQTAAIQDESLAFDQVQLQLDVTGSPASWQVANCSLACDAGEFQLQGDFDTRLPSQDTNNWLSWITSQPAQCQGQVNLVNLAEQLPRSLGLRAGVRLEGGTVTWQVRNEPSADGHALVGAIQTEELAARQLDQVLAMRAPLQVDFRVRRTAESWFVDQLNGSAAFFQLSAKGGMEQGEATLSTNLSMLQSELGQFIDLQPLNLAGAVETKFAWQSENDRWQLAGEVMADNLTVAGLTRLPKQEPHLDIRFDAAGQLERLTLQRLDRLDVVATASEHERLNVRLKEAIPEPQRNSTWPLHVELTGELANWASRLDGLVTLPMSDLRGSVKSQADLLIGPQQITWDVPQLHLRDLQLELSPGQSFQEPVLQVTTQGHYDISSGTVSCDSATIASTVVSLRASHLRWPPPARLDESGLLHYRTDLGKLTHRWQPNADTRIAGHLEGRLQFAPDDDGLSFSSEQQIKNFAMESRDAAGRGYQKLWQEKVLNLNATGQWQPTA
ncbi:MAG: hypothetical protein KDB23_28305, partial [Planctomycetales bacterium]|nr:hypothetical protein [Planctomycetales bacterium]